MDVYLRTTAGDRERERRSRTWNFVEAMLVMAFILFILWGVAYPFGVMMQMRGVQPLSEAGLVLGALYLLVVSPFLHRDSLASWGLGNPWALWRMLKAADTHKRILILGAVIGIMLGLNMINFLHWPEVVRFFNLHETAMRHWNEGGLGLLGVFSFGGVLSFIIAVFAIRYDNFFPAFGTALIVAIPLFAMILAGALAHRGWAAFENVRLSTFLIGIFGYLFWGFVQQLLFSSYFGTRIRKAFGPSKAPGNRMPPARRVVFTIAFALASTAVASALLFALLHMVNGRDAFPLYALPGFAAFLLPLFAAYGYFYALDRKRLLTATLSGSFFGLIHIDSYGLVAVTFLLGIILTYVFMEDRNRNLVALGFIHGLLGSSFGTFFSKGESGALEVDYSVGPWNVDAPTWPVLIIPLGCLLLCLGLALWRACRGEKMESDA